MAAYLKWILILALGTESEKKKKIWRNNLPSEYFKYDLNELGLFQ